MKLELYCKGENHFETHYPAFLKFQGNEQAWMFMNINEYSSSVPGYNSSMDLNWNNTS